MLVWVGYMHDCCYCGATTGVNLLLKLCYALNIAAWQGGGANQGCPTCRRNEVELFLALLSILQDLFICTHNFDEIVLWCYEGFNFGSRRKKKVSTWDSCVLPRDYLVTTFHQIQMKLTWLMHLNGSQISANIHITTEDKVVRRCTNKEKNIIDRCCS